MPYEKKIRAEDAVRLDELAELLVRPRVMVIDVGRRFRWLPEPGSPAERDVADHTVNADLDETTNRGWLGAPRTLCSLHVRDGVEFLTGIATLFAGREVHLNPGTLARSAFECAMRALYVLDPNVTPRQRAARALLDELAGAERKRTATKHLAGRASPAFQAADLAWRYVRDHAGVLFPDEAELRDDPSKWKVAGEVYPRLNAAAHAWAEWRAANGGVGLTPDEAEGIYDFLCLETHPQSYLSHQHATFDLGDAMSGGYATDIVTISKLVLVPTAAMLDAAQRLYLYHGWEVPELDEIFVGVGALWPPPEAEASAA